MSPALIDSLYAALVTALVALLTWGMKKGLAYLDAKTKYLDAEGQSKTKENLKAEIIDAVVVSVSATAQAYVDAIKKGREDGTLTNEEKGEARAQAKARAVQILKEKGLAVGAALLDATVESIVGATKNASGDES